MASITAGKYYTPTLKLNKKNSAKSLNEATFVDIGKIIAADGYIYPVGTENVTPVAMVAFVGNVDGICVHGLGISIHSSVISATQYNASNAANYTTAVTGGEWRLPTILDYQYMFRGCGGYTPITQVSDIVSSGTNRTIFSTGHLESMLKIINDNASLAKPSSSPIYWTNTQHSYTSPVYRYWCVCPTPYTESASFRSGEDYSNTHYIRYCLSF